MTNIVTLSNILEHEGASLEELSELASKQGELWLARFVPVLRGAILIYAKHEDAVKAQEALNGCKLGDTVLCSALGARIVPQSDIEDYQLAAPKRVIQLISPPPSPPDTWQGWDQQEAGCKTPPELVVTADDFQPAVKETSRTRQLNILATDLYSAVQQKLVLHGNGNQDDHLHDNNAPRITIEAPPESLTGIPEGFTLKMMDENKQDDK